MEVIILTTDDWEGFYIDGKLVDEGHVLGEGDNFFFLLRMSEKFGFTSKDIGNYIVDDDELDDYLHRNGSLPYDIVNLPGKVM